MTCLGDICVMRERLGTRGHLEPWLSLLGPPHGGSALATPDYRDGLLATNQMNMSPTGHGLVPPRPSVHTALGHHGRSRGKASVGGHAAQPPPAQHGLYHTFLGRTQGFLSQKRGLALGASTPQHHLHVTPTAGSSSALHLQHE